MKVNRLPNGSLELIQSVNISVYIFLIGFGFLIFQFPKVFSHSITHDHHSKGGYLFAVIFSLVIIGCFWEKSRFLFEVGNQTIFWERNWFFLKNTKGILNFNDVKDVQVEASSSSRSRLVYRIILLTESGVIPLTMIYSGGYSKWLPVVEQIKDTLKIISPTNPSELIKTLLIRGRKIEAIKVARSLLNLSLVEAKDLVEKQDAARGRTRHL